MNEKKLLRQDLLAARKHFYTEDHIGFQKACNTITAKVLSLPEYQKAGSIFVFVSFGDEVETRDIIFDALRSGKRVFIPYVRNKTEGMKAVELKDLSELTAGTYGIMTVEEPHTEAEDLDLIIVPGVAFSLDGYRIGYGAGYYDRFRRGLETFSVAIAFDLQLRDFVPRQSHDLPVDLLLTETKTLHFVERSARKNIL